MRFRRILLLGDLGEPLHDALRTLRRLSPDVDRLHIAVRLPERQISWFARAASADPQPSGDDALATLSEAAAGAAREVEVSVTDDLAADALAERIVGDGIDLVALASRQGAWASTVAEVRRRLPVAVLWAEGGSGDGPLRKVFCVALAAPARRALAAFLRDHGDSDLHVTVLAPTSQAPEEIAALLHAEGVRASVEVVSPSPARRRAWQEGAPASGADLVVLARWPWLQRAAGGAAAPLLLLALPRRTDARRARAIDLPDLIAESGAFRGRVRYATGLGHRAALADERLVVIAGGRELVTSLHGGMLELAAADFTASMIGVRRPAHDGEAGEHRLGEVHARLLRPGGEPLLLIDASLETRHLERLATLAQSVRPLAVRLRPVRSCRSIRARWRAAGLPPLVIDADAVLDEGEAFDVSPLLDAVRLARVATRLLASGYPVVGIVADAPLPPRTTGFAALRPSELTARDWPAPAPPARRDTLGGRLAAIVPADAVSGNRVEVELDNARARRWLLDAIAASRRRVLFQTYMALDDDVGKAVEEALAVAAARGVSVRVLVDSLHGLHGSLGARNPLLERLAGHPGVELRVSGPLSGPPALTDIKQRDHRKMAIVDGALALLGGRNLSHEYYTGFDEVALTPTSPWRAVPWLDAGARLEGPAVALLEEAFRESWTSSGGGTFDVVAPPPVGDVAVRVVTHHGLRDAATLEAYLALIDTAQSHLLLVNGFPLLLEIQHALLRALRRGVRVTTLFGHLTPTHDGTPFEGPWSAARTVATQLVHSRMDALAAAGAEAYRLVVPQQPLWDPGLKWITPHVHAKLMTADGRACAVGSANLDVTAGYWESEVVLLIEDAAITQAVEAHVAGLTAASERVDPEDPQWRATADKRRWMQHWPGVLSV